MIVLSQKCLCNVIKEHEPHLIWNNKSTKGGNFNSISLYSSLLFAFTNHREIIILAVF